MCKTDIHKRKEKQNRYLYVFLCIIKANTSITLEEAQSLIDELRKCDNPFNCPHGRPTIIFYSNYELEKLFKRAMWGKYEYRRIKRKN